MLGAGGIKLIVGAQKPGWEGGTKAPFTAPHCGPYPLNSMKEISKTMLPLTTTHTLASHTKRVLPSVCLVVGGRSHAIKKCERCAGFP